VLSEILKSLYVVLGFKGDDKELDKFAKSMNGIIGVVKGFIAFKAAEKIGRELAGIALGAADNAVRLEQAAMALRYNTEEIQALEYAAGSANVPVQAIISGLEQLRNLQAQAATGEAGAVGILGFGGAPGKDAVETLAKIADRVQGMSPHLQRLYLQRAGLQSLMPLFKQGGEFIRQMAQEAKDLGYTMDEMSIKGGSRLNAEMFKLNARLEVLKNRALKDLIPMGLKLTEILFKLWKQYERFLTMENLTQLIKQLIAQLQILGIVLASIAVLGPLILMFSNLAWTISLLKYVILTTLPKLVAFMGAPLAGILIWGLFAAAIILVIDDLYAFSQGGKSVIGTMCVMNPALRFVTNRFGDMHEALKNARDGLSGLRMGFKDLFPEFAPAIDSIQLLVDKFRLFLDVLAGAMPMLAPIIKAVEFFFANTAEEKELLKLRTQIKEAQETADEARKTGGKTRAQLFDRRVRQLQAQEEALIRESFKAQVPVPAVAPGSNSVVSVNGGTYTVNQQFTGPDVSPQGAGRAAGTALQNAQEREYRQAGTALAGAVR